MASAGWYPDPSGAPGFRYWDGGSWSRSTSPSPYAPAPGAAPSAPSAAPTPRTPPTWAPGGGQGQGGHAGGGWNAGTGPATTPPPVLDPGQGSGRRRTVLVAVGAVVVVLALVAGSLLVVRGLTGDDEPTDQVATSQGADPTDDDPTDDPTDEGDEGGGRQGGGADGDASVQCTLGQPTIDGNQRRGSTLLGGGLSMPAVAGYDQEDTAGAQFTFADGVVASVLVIEQSQTSGWVSEYALGGLNRDNEFASPEAAARTVLDCMENSTFYSTITGSTEVDAVTTTVDGAEAFVLTQEIRVDEPELSVEGDIAQVAVVDTGDESTYGLFVSVVPIGARPLLQQQAAQLMALRVE